MPVSGIDEIEHSLVYAGTPEAVKTALDAGVISEEEAKRANALNAHPVDGHTMFIWRGVVNGVPKRTIQTAAFIAKDLLGGKDSVSIAV